MSQTFKNKDAFIEENIEQDKQEDLIDEEVEKAVKNQNFDVNQLINCTVKTTKDQEKQNIKNQSKKNKKNKAIDYYEYAKNNGIKINIQYEDNNSTNKKDEKRNENKIFNQNNKVNYNYQNESYKKNQNKQFNQNTVSQAKNIEKKEELIEGESTGSNKFDGWESLMNQKKNNSPFIEQPEQVFLHNRIDYNSEFSRESHLENNKILDSLIYYFSLENLNKDFYLRSRLSDSGYIEVNELLSFNKMKESGATVEKLVTALKQNPQSTGIEMVYENGFFYIRNKNWDSIQNKLKPLELLNRKKQNQNNQNKQFNPYNNQFGQYPMNSYAYGQFQGHFFNPQGDLNTQMMNQYDPQFIQQMMMMQYQQQLFHQSNYQRDFNQSNVPQGQIFYGNQYINNNQ